MTHHWLVINGPTRNRELSVSHTLTVMIISTAFTIDLATTAVVTKVFLSRPGLAPVFDRHTSLEVTGRDYRTASLSLSKIKEQ